MPLICTNKQKRDISQTINFRSQSHQCRNGIETGLNDVDQAGQGESTIERKGYIKNVLDT